MTLTKLVGIVVAYVIFLRLHKTDENVPSRTAFAVLSLLNGLMCHAMDHTITTVWDAGCNVAMLAYVMCTTKNTVGSAALLAMMLRFWEQSVRDPGACDGLLHVFGVQLPGALLGACM